MGNNYVQLCLEAIDGGNAIKQVNYQLTKAIENMLDPNTMSKAKRQVILTITIVPDEQRQSAVVAYQAVSKLPADSPGVDMLTIGSNRKTAFIHDKNQMSLGIEVDKEEYDPESGEVFTMKGAKQ